MAGFTVRGAVSYGSGPLDAENRPALVGQTLGPISSTLLGYLASNDPERSQRTRRQLKERYGRLLDRYGGLYHRYMQSEQQEEFLLEFERFCAADLHQRHSAGLLTRSRRSRRSFGPTLVAHPPHCLRHLRRPGFSTSRRNPRRGRIRTSAEYYEA